MPFINRQVSVESVSSVSSVVNFYPYFWVL